MRISGRVSIVLEEEDEEPQRFDLRYAKASPIAFVEQLRPLLAYLDLGALEEDLSDVESWNKFKRSME